MFLLHTWQTHILLCYNQRYLLCEIMSYWPSTQTSYTARPRTITELNQPAAKIAARLNLFSPLAPISSWVFMVLKGIDLEISRLGYEHAKWSAITPRVRGKINIDTIW